MLNIALDEERLNTDNNRGRQDKILGALFFVVVVTLISSVLYSAISWMWDDQRLPLSKIVLQGKLEYVTADDVQAAFSQIDHIGTFMSQDIDVLQHSVEYNQDHTNLSLNISPWSTCSLHCSVHSISPAN